MFLASLGVFRKLRQSRLQAHGGGMLPFGSQSAKRFGVCVRRRAGRDRGRRGDHCKEKEKLI